jgi:protein-S-isoprenylcysteine O-methyltransferase Ste14
MLFFAALLFVFLHSIVIFVEEPGLERRFGDSYRRYKQSVNRWLPLWWR